MYQGLVVPASESQRKLNRIDNAMDMAKINPAKIEGKNDVFYVSQIKVGEWIVKSKNNGVLCKGDKIEARKCLIRHV